MHELLEPLVTQGDCRGYSFDDAWVLNTSPLRDGPSELLFRMGMPACKNPLFVHFGGGAYLSLLANSDFAKTKKPCQVALIYVEDAYFVERNSVRSAMPVCTEVWNPGEAFPENWREVDRVFIRTWKEMDLNMAWVRSLAEGLPPDAEIHLLGSKDDGIRNVENRLSPLAEVRVESIGCHSRWIVVRAGDIVGKIPPVSNYAGIFGGGASDKGTSLLLAHSGDLKNKTVCDLGSGSGVIAAFAVEAGAKSVFATDHQFLAIAHSKAALAKYPEVEHGASFIGDGINEKFDVILTNPPFHLEGRTRIAMGALWLQGAKRLLNAGGEIRLVANEFLDYKRFATDFHLQCDTIAHEKGFRVYSIREAE